MPEYEFITLDDARCSFGLPRIYAEAVWTMTMNDGDETFRWRGFDRKLQEEVFSKIVLPADIRWTNHTAETSVNVSDVTRDAEINWICELHNML